MPNLFLNRPAAVLYDSDARVFDAHARAWRRVPEAATGGEPITLADAVRWLQKESGKPVRAPVAVIGAEDATAAQLKTAEALGAGLADRGLGVLCTGQTGVATAVAKGAAEAGGHVTAILPENDWRAANPYVTTVIASGIGLAHAALVAEASLCLIALGGDHRTATTLAQARAAGRPVFEPGEALTVEAKIALAPVERAALNLDNTEAAWR